jgi:hypothetical protein
MAPARFYHNVLQVPRRIAHEEGVDMSKDTMISFRTTEEFSKSLKKFAKKNKVTLSGFIDAVLQDFLQSQAGQDSCWRTGADFPASTRPSRPSSAGITARTSIFMPAR